MSVLEFRLRAFENPCIFNDYVLPIMNSPRLRISVSCEVVICKHLITLIPDKINYNSYAIDCPTILNEYRQVRCHRRYTVCSQHVISISGNSFACTNKILPKNTLSTYC